MIPSDHFVRFYNEVFKFLDHTGPADLEKFWRHVARHQERHCLEVFRRDGLKGMEDYWNHIRIEENCDLDMFRDERHLETSMNKCPSLSKALDNDATCCEHYCDHCPGWVGRVLTAAGFWLVYDVLDRKKPQCRSYIYPCRQDAEAKLQELQAQGHQLVFTNLEARKN